MVRALSDRFSTSFFDAVSLSSCESWSPDSSSTSCDFKLGLSQLKLMADDPVNADDDLFDDLNEFIQNIALFEESLSNRVPVKTTQSNCSWAVNN